MNQHKDEMISILSKIDRRHIQLALVILALSLFVLGAGAPGALGDFIKAGGN